MKREDRRTRLETVIPLKVPYVIHIETNNTCNFKCKFCFESNDSLLKKYGIKRGIMSVKTFHKIIDDLKMGGTKCKRIYFHVAGEPLLHKNIIEFIQYAKKADVANELVMFTNGALLNKELCEKLAGSGLDFIQISVEGVSSEQYEEVTGVKINYDEFLKNIDILHQEIKKQGVSCVLHAKIVDCNLTEEERKKFYSDFQEIVDECYIENLLDICPTDEMDTTMGQGQTLTQEGEKLREKLVCTIPFYVMDINYDGGVDACSCDWRRKLVMGNVNDENLLEIWRGKKFQALRKMQLSGRRKECNACRDCKAILYQLDDIDEYRDELLKKYMGDDLM